MYKGFFCFLPEICYIGARYAGVSFHRVLFYQDFVIQGFVRQEMGYAGLVIPGVSCYVKGLVVPGFRYTGMSNGVFSLTWPAVMQIYWNKRKRLLKKRVQLPEDWFGTPTWPLFDCFGAPIWPP